MTKPTHGIRGHRGAMISDLRGISTLLGQPTLQRTPLIHISPQCKSNGIHSLCHCAEFSSSEPSGRYRPVHVWSPIASRSIIVHNGKGSKRPARCRAEKPQSLYAKLSSIEDPRHGFSNHRQLLISSVCDLNRFESTPPLALLAPSETLTFDSI